MANSAGHSVCETHYYPINHIFAFIAVIYKRERPYRLKQYAAQASPGKDGKHSNSIAVIDRRERIQTKRISNRS